MTKNVKAFQTTLNVSHEWINDLMMTYDYADDNKAFVLLRATLKSLRDRIPAGEAFHLGSQLPALIRGFYYEGWNPARNPSRERTAVNFLSTVRHHLCGHDDIDLEMAVPEALQLIFNKIDKGEAYDVIAALPEEIRDMGLQ